MAGKRKYPEELLERGARMVFDSGRPVAQVARDLGIHHEAPRKWVRKAEADAGKRKDLLSTEEREELAQLRKDNRAQAVQIHRFRPVSAPASRPSQRGQTKPSGQREVSRYSRHAFSVPKRCWNSKIVSGKSGRATPESYELSTPVENRTTSAG